MVGAEENTLISTFFEFLAESVLARFTRHPDAKAARTAYKHALSQPQESRVASFRDALASEGVSLDHDIEAQLQHSLSEGVPTRRACALFE